MRLLQLTSRWLGSAPADADPADALRRLTETLDYETYVRRRTAPVAVCRSGDDAGLDGRWQAAQASLLRMAQRCREQFGADLALAVGPFPPFAPLAETPPLAHFALATACAVFPESTPFAGHPDILLERTAKQALNTLRLYLSRKENVVRALREC